MKFILFTIFFCAVSFQIRAGDEKFVVGERKRDSLIYYKELRHKTKKIAISYTSNGILVVKDLVSQSIIKRDTIGSVSSNAIKIEDFNHDGVNDIRYGYNSNYFYENILLFDHSSQTWQELKNIKSTEFAYSEQIPHSSVYYSYTPDGCGKNNWLSYLFIIDKGSVKPVGQLQYKQCKDDEKRVYIYRIEQSGQKLLKKLPLQPVGIGKSFYRQYWTKHFKEYLQ